MGMDGLEANRLLADVVNLDKRVGDADAAVELAEARRDKAAVRHVEADAAVAAAGLELAAVQSRLAAAAEAAQAIPPDLMGAAVAWNAGKQATKTRLVQALRSSAGDDAAMAKVLRQAEAAGLSTNAAPVETAEASASAGPTA